MRNIFRKPAEKERIRENSIPHHRFSRSNHRETRSSDADLRCEEAILQDKERFGRTRTSLMKHLRAEFGTDVADRALRRINKRRSEGYFIKYR